MTTSGGGEATATITTMTLDALFGRCSGYVDNMVGDAESMRHRRVEADNESILSALSDPVGFLCMRWPPASHAQSRLSRRRVALRASILERLGMLQIPTEWVAVSVPTVTVAELLGPSADRLMDHAMGVIGMRGAEEVGRAIGAFLAQEGPADLMAAYWAQQTSHMLLGATNCGPMASYVNRQHATYEAFPVAPAFVRFLTNPPSATIPEADLNGFAVPAYLFQAGTISASRFATGTVVAGGVGRPPVHRDDKKFSAKHNVRRVLSRPTRTVFGISVQVEADSSEVFVKPRTEGRE